MSESSVPATPGTPGTPGTPSEKDYFGIRDIQNGKMPPMSSVVQTTPSMSKDSSPKSRRGTLRGNDRKFSLMDLNVRTTSPRSETPMAPVRLGICAMEKKTSGKPMKAILERLRVHGEFDIIIWTDKQLIDDPIESWPQVDALVSFFSTGFPLEKAIAYAKLRKPFLINELEPQVRLLDRSQVYAMLEEAQVPVPYYAVMHHTQEGQEFIETEDEISVGGKVFTKPFVEKPISGEDHNIIIYFPTSAGGGSQHLFRKKANKSSEFRKDWNKVRRDGSYLYEEFLTTQGTDVKVYTVGPSYAHAEARKSPSLDGIVVRNKDGKEVRYPVMLTSEEKAMAHRIVNHFQQTVCGFDLLRTFDRSFVCDVNGWSFVKSSQKYYDDCAQLLREMCLWKCAPDLYVNALERAPQADSKVAEEMFESPGEQQGNISLPHKEELRCVCAIVRHGDRTPKQKMKLETNHPMFCNLFEKYGDPTRKKELKLKTPEQLQEILDISRELHADKAMVCIKDPEASNHKLIQMRHVLEKGGHFSGINRKVQLKPLEWEEIEHEHIEKPESEEATDSPRLAPPVTIRVRRCLLILKWGGELTHSGIEQSKQLASRFRSQIYPGEGLGLLRLHSTFRHDLKIYSGDEGRVQMTAAAFTKAFLDLEGDLTPILVSLVRKDEVAVQLLDDASAAHSKMEEIKKFLKENLLKDQDMTDPEVQERIAPSKAGSLIRALSKVGNGRKRAEEIFHLILKMVDRIKVMCEEEDVDHLIDGMNTILPPSRRNSDDKLMVDSPVIEENFPSKSVLKRINREVAQLPMSSSHNDLTGLRPMSTGHLLKHMPSSAQNSPPHTRRNTVGSNEDVTGEEGAKDGDVTNDSSATLGDDVLKMMAQKYIEEKINSEAMSKGPKYKVCGDETLYLLLRRWEKLAFDFYNKRKDKFDVSKIPDIYDCVKYDEIHNHALNLTELPEIYSLVKPVADLLVPQEYGLHESSKVEIGGKIAGHLIRKLRSDLRNAMGLNQDAVTDISHRLDDSLVEKNVIKSRSRSVRTRLYFTSESHLHALLNLLRFSGGIGKDGDDPVWDSAMKKIEDLSELNYLSHIVLRLFENTKLPLDDPSRFRMEIHVSPGANIDPRIFKDEKKHILPILPMIQLTKSLTLQSLDDLFGIVQKSSASDFPLPPPPIKAAEI
eukprot:Clim_evm15s5 gene=Clim_evmTU15s5